MCRTERIVLYVCLILALAGLPLVAGAQEEDVMQIESTGLPAAASPEELLPQGAVVHLRANNLEALLKNLGSFLTSFVPEKAVPPPFQPFLQSPHPFLAFLTTQMFGQEMPVSALSAMFGIALDKPVSLSFYPMDPSQGFVLSVPIANLQGFTGSVQNFLRPEELEMESAEGLNFYYFEPASPDMPEEIYLLTSDSLAFFCGSLQVAYMLADSDVEKLDAVPLHSKGLQKYAEHALLLLLDPTFIKPQIPMMKDSFGGVLEPLYQQLRAMVAQIPPDQRIMLDMRLRWELGIENLEQLLGFFEAYTSAFYKVSLDWGTRWAQELDGLALAIEMGETIQQVSVTIYSQGIQPENFSAPLSIPEVEKALSVLPGSKHAVNITGQAPPCLPSRFVQDVLLAAEQELKQRDLPLQAFSALKRLLAERQQISPLEFKTPWTISTMLKTTDAISWEEFESLPDLFAMMLEFPSLVPVLTTVSMMPETEIETLKSYFHEKAEMKNSNAEAFRNFRGKLPLAPPLFDASSHFYSEEFDNGVTALVFENIYTTRRGYFGYQEHEWVNRRMMLSENKQGYTYLYDWLPDEAIQNTLMQAEPEAVSSGMLELFGMLPPDVNTLRMLKTLPAVSNLLFTLSNIEDIAFRELDRFLEDVTEILAGVDDAEVQEALLASGIDIPFLVLRLKRDDAGSLYCVLPGGLHYPRPPVMPAVQELFGQFNQGIGQAGGSLAYTAVRAGELESTAFQRSDALALLVKSVANNVFEKYLSTPDGINLLFSQIAHPKDRALGADTLLFTNVLWENIRKALDSSGEPEMYELADVLVPSDEPEEAEPEEMEESDIPPLPGEAEPEAEPMKEDTAPEEMSEPDLEPMEEETKMMMRAIGTALGSYMVDFNVYPATEGEVPFAQAELPEDYYNGVTEDAWGNAFRYNSDGGDYSLKSNGEDGIPETEDDILYENGMLLTP